MKNLSIFEPQIEKHYAYKKTCIGPLISLIMIICGATFMVGFKIAWKVLYREITVKLSWGSAYKSVETLCEEFRSMVNLLWFL